MTEVREVKITCSCGEVFTSHTAYRWHRDTCIERGKHIPPDLQMQRRLHRGILVPMSALRGDEVQAVGIWYPGGRGTLSAEVLFELSNYLQKGWIKVEETPEIYQVDYKNPLGVFGCYTPPFSAVTVSVYDRFLKGITRLYVPGPEVKVLYKYRFGALCFMEGLMKEGTLRVRLKNASPQSYLVLERYNKDGKFEPVPIMNEENTDIWVAGETWDIFIPLAEKTTKCKFIISEEDWDGRSEA